MDKERLSEREKDIDRESERQRKLDNCGLSKSKVDFAFPAMHCLNQPEKNSILLWEILVLEGKPRHHSYYQGGISIFYETKV